MDINSFHGLDRLLNINLLRAFASSLEETMYGGEKTIEPKPIRAKTSNLGYSDSDKIDEEIREIGRELAEYLFNENIKRIMFIDSSARPGYLALKGAWKQKYPNEIIPEIYFTNPKGYHEDVGRGIGEIVEEFDKTFTRLSSNKNSPLMIFDVCRHTGSTLKSISDILEIAGYTDVRIGLAQKETEESDLPEVNFFAMNSEPEGSCYPFYIEHIVRKNYSSIVSSKNNSLTLNISRGRNLRKRISNLF